ncbi:MAG: hypothetical protein ABH859_05080 [Pseudomonadota bacterium]
MFNGGEVRQPTAEERAQLRDLTTEYNGVQESLDQLNETLSDRNQVAYDAGQEYGTVDQRAEAAHGRVLSRQDAAYARDQQLKDVQRQLGLAFDNAARSFDLANFMNQHAIEQLRHDMIQAGLELYCENLLAGQEAMASFFRGSLIMMRAEMGASAGGRLSAEFNRPNYFRLQEPAQNQSPEYYARARNEEGNYLSQLHSYEDRAADTADQERLAQARTEERDYRQEARRSEHDRDEARAAVDETSEARTAESARLRRLQERMQEIRDRPYEDSEA